jgi:taurine transport system permease protein
VSAVLSPPEEHGRLDGAPDDLSGFDEGSAASRRARGWARTIGLRAAALGAFLAVWWAVTAAEIWTPVLVPPPSAVWDAFLSVAGIRPDAAGRVGYGDYLLHEHLWASLRRIAVGAGLGTLAGIAIGLAIGVIPIVRIVLEPFVTFLRQLPPLAYFSLLIIWFGIDEAPKIWLLMIAAMPPVAVATASGVSGVHRDYLNGARSLGAGRWSVIRYVSVPAALPEIVVGIRLGVGVAYTSVVAAETVNGVPGIGGMIRDAQRYLHTDVVIMGIIVLGLSGLVIDSCLSGAERRLGPWRGSA